MFARCSAKGCRSQATVDLRWRNPALHDSTRVKHWVSCADHADHLAGFLDRRGFLLSRGLLEVRPDGEVTSGGDANG